MNPRYVEGVSYNITICLLLGDAGVLPKGGDILSMFYRKERER